VARVMFSYGGDDGFRYLLAVVSLCAGEREIRR
jgi:hypothetical protein